MNINRCTVIGNTLMLIVVLVLTVPIAILAMWIAMRAMKKRIAALK